MARTLRIAFIVLCLSVLLDLGFYLPAHHSISVLALAVLVAAFALGGIAVAILAERLTTESLGRLRARAARELPPRLLELAAAHGLCVTRISVRNQRWRWGSCSRSGHICLNWRLVRMPPDVRDYVMIHELMHLKRMDHSPRFWKLVAAACPEYQAARQWLREHGRVRQS